MPCSTWLFSCSTASCIIDMRSAWPALESRECLIFERRRPSSPWSWPSSSKGLPLGNWPSALLYFPPGLNRILLAHYRHLFPIKRARPSALLLWLSRTMTSTSAHILLVCNFHRNTWTSSVKSALASLHLAMNLMDYYLWRFQPLSSDCQLTHFPSLQVATHSSVSSIH